MLTLPTHGVARSVTEHNVQPDAICDWIEGSALFSEDGSVSASEVVDVLVDEGIYETQEFAWDLVGSTWEELERRARRLGGNYPLDVEQNKVARPKRWQTAPAYSFCLLLSYVRWYPDWSRRYMKDYAKHGALFERLTSEALGKAFSAWIVEALGWNGYGSKPIATLVDHIAEQMRESVGDIDTSVISAKAKDAGLDVICFRSFPDDRPVFPVLLFQCATGKNFEDKLSTPNIDIWRRMVKFTIAPYKAFATPFAFSVSELKRFALKGNCVLLDRFRVIPKSIRKTNWLSEKLASDLETWITPRIKNLDLLED